MEEKQEFFVRAGQIEDEDELMDELNELEAQMAEEEFDQMDVGTGAVEYGKKEAPVKAQEQSEEDELKALERLMA